MRLIIESYEDHRDYYTEKTKQEIMEDLKQQLFEVCEDWIIKGKEPKFKEVKTAQYIREYPKSHFRIQKNDGVE
jgi:hypothetical protein